MITQEGHTDYVYSVAFSPDGKSVVSGSSDKTVRIWDANSSSPIGEPLRGHSRPVESVSYSPLSNLIASGSFDNTIRLWDPSTCQQSGEALKGDHAFWSVAFSPDAKLIASGSSGSSFSPTGSAVQLWDVETRKATSGPLKGHNAGVQSVSFSPDGARLVSGSNDKTIRVWDVEQKSPTLEPLEGHTHYVRSVAFSPDSAQIVSCSSDRTIRLWDPRTGQPIGNPYTGHNGSVCSVSFSPRGTYIASGSSDKTVRLWDVRTGRQVGQPFEEHTNEVTSAAFSPCGQFVASGSGDCKVIIRRVLGEDQYPAASDVEPQEAISQMEVGQDNELDGDVEPQMITSQPFIPESHKDPNPNDDVEPQIVTQEVNEDDGKAGNLDPRMATSEAASVQESREDPDPDDDAEPQVVTSQMSTQQIFDFLCRAGCIDLSLQMDTRQEKAMIVSGGGFGDIWKGEMHTGIKVAIKAWRTYALGPCDYKTLKRAARELYLWSRMDHPHIHQLQGVILFRDQYLGMVSEWMDNGNLHEYLMKHPGADRYQLCIHVASGLEYMHSRGTVHGDLKALNVLVTSDGIARLSDFDFSIMSDASNLVFTATSNTRTGSVRWVAPELIEDDSPKRTTQSDVYALGMTILEVFTGEAPYPERRIDAAVIRVVMLGILPTRPAQHLKTDEHGNRVWKVMLDCWSRTPSARPSAGQVLQVLESGTAKA